MEIVVSVGKRKTRVVKEKDGVLYVDVKGKAENNQANNEIIRFFSKNKRFNNNFLEVRIVKGLKSKKKILSLDEFS